MDLYPWQRERVAYMQTYIHSATLPVEDRDLYTKLLCRWTSIFGRDRVECIDVCISYHPGLARYMSVFKHTETRHISCGTRMPTYAEPDVDSVDWSKKICWEVVIPQNAFASNQKDRPSEYFQDLCPYLEDCKSKDTPRVNQSLPLKVMTWNTSSDRLECLLMRTLWRPRSIWRCITHARSFTSTFRVY